MTKSKRKLMISLLVAMLIIVAAVAVVTLAFAAQQQNISTTLTIGYVAQDLDGSVYATYKIGNGETKYMLPTGVDNEHIDGNSLVFKAKDTGSAGTLEFPESDKNISLKASESLIIQYTYSNTGDKHYMASLSFDSQFNYNNIKIEYSKDGTVYNSDRYAVVVPARTDNCSYWIKITIDNKSQNASLSGDFNWMLKGCDKQSESYISLTSLEFTGSDGSYSVSVASAGSGQDGRIVFPSQINGDPVTTITQSSLTDEEKDKITEVVIPNSVTKIADSAFKEYKSLTAIEIPDSVETVENYAFYSCTSLTSLKIGKNLSSIGYNWPFVRTPNLTSIIIDPENATYYSGDTNGEYNCIMERATKKLVAGCKTTIIPNDTEIIGSAAFILCLNLTSINIPASVTNVNSQNPFGGCINLTSITVDSGNTNYYIENNCLMEKATKRLVSGVNKKDITIPTDTLSIGASAFYFFGRLTSIDVPTGVTEICTGAFQNCSSLQNVTLPNTLTTIKNNAFNSTNMKTITIPASVTNIEYATFIASQNLESIIIEEGNERFSFQNGCIIDNEENRLVVATKSFTTIPTIVTTIERDAFSYLTTLTDITISTNIKYIGYNAFNSCENLDSVTFEDTSGWKAGNNSLSSSNLSNSQTAATYLKTTYKTYTWTQS